MVQHVQKPRAGVHFVAPIERPHLELEVGYDAIQLARNVKRAKQRQILDGKAPEMHYVEVLIGLDVEAQSTWQAEAKAWELVKEAIEHVKGAKVLSAHTKGE